VSTAPDVVPLGPGDLPQVVELDATAFVFAPDPGDRVDYLEWDRTFGVRRDGRLIGLDTTFSLTLALPDGGTGVRTTPMAGLSWVAVHPGHRRQGILRELVRHHLHELHGRGDEPVSGLHASEPVIYGRFGYGVATTGLRVEISRGATLRDLPGSDDVSIGFETADVERHGDLVHDLHARAGRRRPGWVGRGVALSRSELHDTPRTLEKSDPLRILVARRHGVPTGYAIVRRTMDWKGSAPTGSVSVRELAALDAATEHRLWRTVTDLDLMGTTSARGLADDDPLLLWLVDPRAARPVREDELWLRVVDVDRALVARGYASDVDLVLAVTDELCPWTSRRWRLRGTAGAAGSVTCEPTTDEADVGLDVRELGSLLVGGVSALALGAAGLLQERTAGAVSVLSQAMRSPKTPASPYSF
jgi:predicted acetyltransferase